jgi:uncharacterized membrane protein (UPF0127 family)
MNKTKLIIFLLLISAGCTASGTSADQVCFEQACFSVETVSTLEQRSLGLMHRKSMDADKGMLFIFQQAQPYTFWMKNTLIPLDIIWLDHARRVVHIEKNVPPCKHDPCADYHPLASALYVLEINAGLSEKKNIRLGDTAQFNLSLDQSK